MQTQHIGRWHDVSTQRNPQATDKVERLPNKVTQFYKGEDKDKTIHSQGGTFIQLNSFFLKQLNRFDSLKRWGSHLGRGISLMHDHIHSILPKGADA
jgi:uncharacterized protein YozE (UPF0346 family)